MKPNPKEINIILNILKGAQHNFKYFKGGAI
jgi:hypothetical protein